MSKSEKIQELLNRLNHHNSDSILLEIPKGWKSAVETMSKNKIFFTAKQEDGLIFTFTRIK